MVATRSLRYTQLLSSHPYHASISSSPSFSSLDTTYGGDDDDDHGTGGAATSIQRPQDDGLLLGAALASPRLTELPRGAVCASDRFFVSLARTASLVEEGAGELEGLCERGGALLVEKYSSDPRGEFLESMDEMAAAFGAEGMPAPEYRQFMEELLSCYLERNDRAVHPHVRAAFADLTARRQLAKRNRPFRFRGLMKISPCVSGTS